MARISAEEQARRRESNESVIGTSAMEGIVLDPPTLRLMERFEEGELSREELSAAVQAHVEELFARRRNRTQHGSVSATAA